MPLLSPTTSKAPWKVDERLGEVGLGEQTG